MPVYAGTSGWQYRDWRGRFYPRKPAPDDDLAFYAARFQTVELNATFYRLPEADTFAGWAKRVPGDFVFAMKASRFLTHVRRLRDPQEAVERMMSRARRLGRKLGPVLLQLPPDMRRDGDRLRATLRAFPRRTRVAVEFRHPSWFDDAIRRLLEDHGAALCLADRGSRLITPAWRTADWGYIRFHEGRSKDAPCYGETALRSRAALVAATWGPSADVFVYFNNDAYACAVRDAALFARAARRCRLDVSRTPDIAQPQIHLAGAI